ncbi:conserved hypothetical protein [Cupriavidus taiwanensis]|uniref:Uncharacterized protein n=1 Tax=Cupriavidus taiwanensis TaxID=164546 RepID=A0A7Z7NQK1_9BURK|nr:conserved hypothetical protein [Cupriavidus taiwanensis]SPC26163.1 conserved hypothetical protein [Cupriavidus taiwanensis]
MPAALAKPADPVVHIITRRRRAFSTAFPKSPAPKVPLEDLLPDVDKLALTKENCA